MSDGTKKEQLKRKSPWLNAAVIVVLIILVSIGGMFYLFVDSQTHYLTKRNFRLLTLHGSLLSKRLAIQEEVFKHTIKPELESIESGKLNELIKNNNSVECPQYKKGRTANLKNQYIAELNNRLCDFFPSQATISLHFPDKTLKNVDKDRKAFSFNDAEFSINPEAQGSNSRFRLKYYEAGQEPRGINVFFPVDYLMEQLEIGVEQHIFDDLLLADKTGQILYQKQSSVFQYDSVVTLLLGREMESFFSNNNGKQSSESTKRAIDSLSAEEVSKMLMRELPASRDIEIADLAYKVFAQAVTFPRTRSNVSSETKPDPNASKAILIGLIETGKFRNQVHAISPVYLVFLLFLGMGLVFGLPFLKLWTMGPQDRLTVVDVLSLFFSCLIGTALLVFFLLYSYVSWTDQERVTSQLNIIADNINGTFQEELRDALDQLKALSSTSWLADDLKKLKNSNDSNDEWPRRNTILKDGPVATYPFYDQVFWMSENGQQQIKWSTQERVTPFVNVSTRSYFQRVQEANRTGDPELFLMQYDSGGLEDFLLKPMPPMSIEKLDMESVQWKHYKPSIHFWLEPVLSMTRGTFIPVLSRSADKKTKRDFKLPVVSMTPDMISLQQVRLPPGFGFAVVNSGQSQDFPEGQVLFHSEKKRNLRENLLKVTDENSTLQSLIRLGNTGEVKTRYWGEAHTFYVRPLVSTPWALVVFANNRVLWTPIHQPLMMASVLFAIYAFFVIVVFFLGLLVFRTVWLGKRIWLWPQPKLAQSYRVALTLNLIIMLLFGAILWQIANEKIWSHSLLTATAFLPILGIFVLVFVVQNQQKEDERAAASSDPKACDKWDYLHLLMSLLILLSIMPAFGFFKLSYDAGAQLFRNDLQIGYQERIVERAETMLDQYRKVPGIISTNDNAERFIKNIMQTSETSVSEHTDKKSLWSCSFLTTLPMSQNIPTWYAWLRTKFAFHPLSGRVAGGLKNPEFVNQIERLCPNYNFEPWNTAGFITDPLPLSGWLFGIPIGGLLTFVCVRLFRFTLPLAWRTSILTIIRTCIPLVIAILGILLSGMIIWYPHVLEQILFFPSLWILLFFVLFTILFLLPRFIVRRVFLFDVEMPIRWKAENLSHLLQHTAQLEFPGMLLVGPPGSGKSTAFKKASGHVFYPINLREMGNNSRHIWDAVKQSQDTVIMMDHFEYARGTQEYDEQKLELLEELLRRNKRLCVISDIHPLDKEYFLDSSDDESSGTTRHNQYFLNRWTQVFQMFVTVPFSGTKRKDRSNPGISTQTHLNKFGDLLTRTKKKETHVDPAIDSSEWSVEGMRSLARSYYESLWASCTNDEKLSLYHLAVDRFLHSENPNFRALYEKGLIEIRPDLRFMNESFRQFVLAVGEKDNIAILETHGPGSVWNMMHRPLIVGLVILGVFLVTTQESIKSDFLGFVSLIPIALPALAKGLSIFRQSKYPG